MLWEVDDLKIAFKAYIDGQDVKVMLPMEEGEERVIPIGRLFREARLLIDQKTEEGAQVPPTLGGVSPKPSGGTKNQPPGMWVPAPKRKNVDRGKVMALHRAGWTNRKIADEMRIHECTVSRVIREEVEKETAERIAANRASGDSFTEGS